MAMNWSTSAASLVRITEKRIAIVDRLKSNEKKFNSKRDKKLNVIQAAIAPKTIAIKKAIGIAKNVTKKGRFSGKPINTGKRVVPSQKTRVEDATPAAIAFGNASTCMMRLGHKDCEGSDGFDVEKILIPYLPWYMQEFTERNSEVILELHQYTVHCASFRVITPPTIMAAPRVRQSVSASPKNKTPIRKVPTPPIPVQTA